MRVGLVRVVGFLTFVALNVAGSTQQSKNYKSVSLCEIASLHSVEFVSIDAELWNAMPHGLFLIDETCPKKKGYLQIDFARTGLDPSLKPLQNHLFEFHRATGTFRGRVKLDPETKRLYLWLESVLGFKCDPCSEPYEDKPIGLPDTPAPTLPPSPKPLVRMPAKAVDDSGQ